MEISSVIKEAQKIQKQIELIQKDFFENEYFFEFFSSKIKIRMKGNKKINSIEINPSLFVNNDTNYLLSILTNSINEAMDSIQVEFDEKISSIGGNFEIIGGI